MEKTSIQIVKKLQKAGFEAFFAGGCVRDFLLGKEPKDFDICTSAKPDEIEKILSHTIPIGKQFGVILTIKNGHHFEIATFRKDSETSDGRRPHSVKFTNAEEDARRRDFTINGIFYDPIKKQIYDYVSGQQDLKAKIIRFIGIPHLRILEDHLRIIRAIRFKNTLNFSYHPDTYQAIKNHSNLSSKVSNERLHDEFNKILQSDNLAQAFEDLSNTGVLKYVLPELEKLRGVAQPIKYHKEGDCFVHTMKCLSALPKHAPLNVKYTVLLHDIGKPDTFKNENGEIHFYGHNVKGVEIAKKLLHRLKFPKKMSDEILWLVKHHMMVNDFFKMRKARRRHWFIKPSFKYLLEVFKADIRGSEPSDENLISRIEKLYEKEIKEVPEEPKKLLNGEDIMKALKLPPSKKIGKILEKLREEQLGGKIKTKKDAREWLKKITN